VRFRVVRFAILASLTLLSYAAGWAIGVPAIVPVLNTLPALAFMYRHSAAARRRRPSP
jgi:hypothetical protein